MYFILKSLDFFIKENVVSLFHWALFVLNFDFDENVQRFQNKVDKYFAHLLGGSTLLLFRLRACASNGRLSRA